MFNPIQTKGENRRAAAQHRALGLGCLCLTDVTVDTLYFFACEVGIQALLHTFYSLNLEREVEEFLLILGGVATLSARQVRVVDSEEHLFDQRLISSALQSRLNRLKQDSVQLLNVLLLLAFSIIPAKRAC